MSHPLDNPSLYKRCVRYAMSLCRGWANQTEEALDLVQEAYIRAIRSWKYYNSAKAPLENWVIMKVRDVWQRLLEKRSGSGRKLVSLMADVRSWDEKGNEVEPEIIVQPRQEKIVYLQERIGCMTAEEQQKYAEEIACVTTRIRNLHPIANWRDAERWNKSQAVRRCEPDLWAKRQIARCDLRWPRKDRARARLAAERSRYPA